MRALSLGTYVRVTLLAACLPVLAVGCPPPDTEGELRVLLVNATDKTLNVFFNTTIQNHVSSQNNRIDLVPEAVVTARFAASDLGALAPGSQLVVFVSAVAGGTPLYISAPQQIVPNPVLGGQAAVLVTACGDTGVIRIADVAAGGF